MKTLNEVINLRQHKYDEDRKNPSFTDFFKGYHSGWFDAYRDFSQILEQNGFNMDVVIIDNDKGKKEERCCKTCYADDMEWDEVDNPCWNCKGDHSEWYPK